MKVVDFIIIFVLICIIIFSLYVLWSGLYSIKGYKEFYANTTKGLSEKSTQFYPNMRFPDRIINYTIGDFCSKERVESIKEAFSLISRKTILVFREVEKEGQIEILCSSFLPSPEQRGHFVAGEGGPIDIINASEFAVIKSGKISLYRTEQCNRPQIAIHEILHALGFDHNNNTKSIMFPITQCNQEIDEEIIYEINRLYSFDSAPDIIIERANSSLSGRFLDFNIVILNAGLKEAKEVVLEIISDREVVKTFEFGDIPIGTRKYLSVQNLRLPHNSRDIVFSLKTSSKELNYINNRIVLHF